MPSPDPLDFPLGPQRPVEFAPVLAEDFSILIFAQIPRLRWDRDGFVVLH